MNFFKDFLVLILLLLWSQGSKDLERVFLLISFWICQISKAIMY